MRTTVTAEDCSASPARKGAHQSLEAATLPDALLRISTVVQWVGLSPATIYRKMDKGQFPRPVRFGARCTRWRAADIRKWMDSQRASM